MHSTKLYNMKNLKLLNKIIKFICIIAVFIMVFILNYFTKFSADDYAYMYSFADGTRITSFNEIISSQIQHYNTVNGKFIAHVFAQSFLMLPPLVFDFINSLAFVFLIILMCLFVDENKQGLNIKLFLILSVFMLTFLPAFAEVCLWTTGSANYLYGIIFILLFLMPYRYKNAQTHKKSQSIILAVLMFVFGCIAGASSESNVVMAIIIIILELIYYRIKNIKYDAWNFTGLAGMFVGLFSLLLSPGTASRVDTLGGGFNIPVWINRFINYFFEMIVVYGVFLFIFILLFSIALKNKENKNLFQSIIFMITAILGILLMVILPTFPKRAWSGSFVFLLISVGNIYLSAKPNLNVSKLVQNTLAIFIIVYGVSAYWDIFFAVKNRGEEYDNRQAHIQQQIENGDTDITIQKFDGDGQYVLCDGLQYPVNLEGFLKYNKLTNVVLLSTNENNNTKE